MPSRLWRRARVAEHNAEPVTGRPARACARQQADLSYAQYLDWNTALRDASTRGMGARDVRKPLSSAFGSEFSTYACPTSVTRALTLHPLCSLAFMLSALCRC